MVYQRLFPFFCKGIFRRMKANMPSHTLGFLVTDLKHEQAYLTEIAKKAAYFGMKCVRFRPEDIHRDFSLITCFHYHPIKEQWEKRKAPLPNIIYDRCYYDAPFSTQKQTVHQLKTKKDVLFLGHGLPNKWKVYEALQQTNIKRYLPDTFFVYDVDTIFQYVHLYQHVMLKPQYGANGRGIITLLKERDHVSLHYFSNDGQLRQKLVTKKQAMTFFQRLLAKSPYLLQPLLSLQTDDNRPFDLRILMQKNGQGEWQVQGKGIRIGMKDAFVSNVTKGGAFLPFDRWFTATGNEMNWALLSELHNMLFQLLRAIEKKFSPLFELGIDVGIEWNKQRLWILDINSKPGRKVVLETEPEKQEQLYEAPVLYALYLLHQKEVTRNEGERSSRRI